MKLNPLSICISLCAMCIALACASPRTLSEHIGDLYLDSLEFDKHFHAGFSLYDVQTNQLVYQHDGDHFFIPASTTKLWTYYGAMHYFADSIPVFEWTETDSAIYIRGVGSPVWLHRTVDDKGWIPLLQRANKPIVYIPQPAIPKYNPGWSWDDYAYSYQTERSTAPVYGNLATVSLVQDSVSIHPKLPYNIDSTQHGAFYLSYDKKILTFNPLEFYDEEPTLIPLAWSDSLVVEALSQALSTPVTLQTLNQKTHTLKWSTYFNHNTDQIYKLMLHHSDNFVAEQLLLTIAYHKYRDFNIKQIIQELQIWAVNNAFANKWVDGSGLSRYNLFTPNHMTKLLSRMYTEFDKKRLFDHLALGGYTDGVKVYYSEIPMLSAKTGTLSNIHNLCGFFFSKNNKVYAFSLMNNHFMSSSSEVKDRMKNLFIRLRKSSQ